MLGLIHLTKIFSVPLDEEEACHLSVSIAGDTELRAGLGIHIGTKSSLHSVFSSHHQRALPSLMKTD